MSGGGTERENDDPPRRWYVLRFSRRRGRGYTSYSELNLIAAGVLIAVVGGALGALSYGAMAAGGGIRVACVLGATVIAIYLLALLFGVVWVSWLARLIGTLLDKRDPRHPPSAGE